MSAELDRPIPKCIASAALLTMIFINKYIYHLPLYRTLNQIRQMGVPLPSSTLESWVKLAAELLRPLYAIHRLYVFMEIYLMIDESPIKVQDKDKQGSCHQGYMWVRYAPLSKSVLFEYYPSRSTKEPIADLSAFTGYILKCHMSSAIHCGSTNRSPLLMKLVNISISRKAWLHHKAQLAKLLNIVPTDGPACKII